MSPQLPSVRYLGIRHFNQELQFDARFRQPFRIDRSGGTFTLEIKWFFCARRALLPRVYVQIMHCSTANICSYPVYLVIGFLFGSILRFPVLILILETLWQTMKFTTYSSDCHTSKKINIRCNFDGNVERAIMLLYECKCRCVCVKYEKFILPVFVFHE